MMMMFVAVVLTVIGGNGYPPASIDQECVKTAISGYYALSEVA
jgi:hypothetical protein